MNEQELKEHRGLREYAECWRRTAEHNLELLAVSELRCRRLRKERDLLKSTLQEIVALANRKVSPSLDIFLKASDVLMHLEE